MIVILPGPITFCCHEMNTDIHMKLETYLAVLLPKGQTERAMKKMNVPIMYLHTYTYTIINKIIEIGGS